MKSFSDTDTDADADADTYAGADTGTIATPAGAVRMDGRAETGTRDIRHGPAGSEPAGHNAGSTLPSGSAGSSGSSRSPGASEFPASGRLPQPPAGSAQPPASPSRSGRGAAWLLLLVLAAAAVGGWYYWNHWRPAQAARTAAVNEAPGAGAARSAAAPGGAPGAPGARAAGGRGPAEPLRIPVAAQPAQAGDVPIVLDALGTVVPTQTVSVQSRVAGLLERVHFREGELVKEGQLLAEIDPRGLKVQLAQAAGQLARDRALLENARVDLRRYETLFRQDSIARQQVDTQRALVRQYEGLIQVNDSVVDNARLQLSYARVTAPISGRAGLRQVDAGNMVTGAEVNGLVVITQVEPIAVLFSLPQDDLPKVIKRISSGEKLPVKAFDRTQQNLLATGVLASLDNQIDPATGTIKLKAEFANTDGQLFPNQFVNARLELDTLRNVITVPSSALQRGSQGLFVYIVKPDQTVALRTVTMGPVDGQRITLASGIEAGELVVVDGVDRLREGSAVELVGRPDFQAPPPPRSAEAAEPAPQRRRPAGPPR